MDDQPLDARVASLAQELARAINGSAAESRERLREMAVQLVRDEVEVVSSATMSSAAAGTATNSFNPFGVGIPLFLVGGVLTILFPPVGVLLCMAAVGMMVWGLAATMWSHR